MLKVAHILQSLLTRKVGFELMRYCLVGGLAFLMDFVTLVCCREMFLKQYRFGVYLSVMLGFIIGHVSNYLLSLWFVFRDESEREKGWTRRAFTLFLVVGIIGAGITEFGMWIGYGCFNFNCNCLYKCFILS